MESMRRWRGIVRGLIRRGRAMLVVVIAGAVITTISPLATGSAHAATALPANESVLVLRANQDSGHASGCSIQPKNAPDTGQPTVLRAIEAACDAGVSVTAEERTHDGTTVTYSISGSGDTSSASHPNTWWLYQTVTLHGFAVTQAWTDYSANLNKELVKAASKAATKISVYLSLLASILSAVMSNSKVAAIIAVVAATLAVVGMNLKKWYKIIRKYVKGNGKHTGWYNDVKPSGKRILYIRDAVRSCAAGWWSLKCGSPGKLWPRHQE